MTQHRTPSHNALIDHELVEMALSGNQNAYAELIKKYKRALSYHILKIVRDREVVDDLLQEIFTKAFHSLDLYDKNFAFSTWLYRIASNHSIDYLRKKKLKTSSLDIPIRKKEGEIKREYPDEYAQTDRHVIQSERKMMVRKAILELPEKYKKVIWLRHMEEKSYEEIATELDLPEGTVKAHIFRARELLNKSLKKKIKAYWR